MDLLWVLDKSGPGNVSGVAVPISHLKLISDLACALFWFFLFLFLFKEGQPGQVRSLSWYAKVVGLIPGQGTYKNQQMNA